MKPTIILGVIAASVASSVHAENYKSTTDAAYCLGVYQSETSDTQKKYINEKDAKPPAAEAKLLQTEAFVDAAVRQHRLHPMTAAKMRNVGYTVGNTCLQRQDHCTERWYARAENKIDPETNREKLASCNSLAAVVCERAYEKCE